MKKTAFSLIAIAALGHFAYAGGDIVPVEPVVETPAVEDTHSWKQELAIYGWFPSISATTPLPDSGESIDASDIIENIKMTFMGSYGARYDKWSFIGDVVYLDLGDSPNGDAAYVNYDLKSLLINAGVGYNLIEAESGILDMIGGIRYADIEASVRTEAFLNRDISRSKDFTDFFIGVKGHRNINENWYIPYEADIGTGDTDLSWQAFAGVGYRYDWGDVKLGYRHLELEMEDDAFVEDFVLSGPVIGASIKF